MPSASDGSAKTCSPRITAGTSVRSPGEPGELAQAGLVEQDLALRPQRTVADQHQPRARAQVRRLVDAAR